MLERSELEALVDEYAPGFSTSIRPEHGSVVIALEHPASIGTQLVLPSTAEYSDERFAAWLRDNPEVRRIRRAPQPLEHPVTCLRVYNASQALGWGPATLREVTDMLVQAGGLAQDEADWLRSTT